MLESDKSHFYKLKKKLISYIQTKLHQPTLNALNLFLNLLNSFESCGNMW